MVEFNPSDYPMGFKSKVEGEKAGEVLVELSLAGGSGGSSSPSSDGPAGSSTSSGSQPAASSPYPTPPSPASSSSSKGKEQGESAPIFILTLLSRQTPDNRLTPQLLTAILAALEHLSDLWESSLLPAQSPPPAAPTGAALVLTGTTSGPSSKFFSNGLDFESAITTMGFFDLYLFPVYEKLMTFPLPVVAAIGGHCFAAGWGLMAACDYAVMGGKGFMAMNEVSGRMGQPMTLLGQSVVQSSPLPSSTHPPTPTVYRSTSARRSLPVSSPPSRSASPPRPRCATASCSKESASRAPKRSSAGSSMSISRRRGQRRCWTGLLSWVGSGRGRVGGAFGERTR